jgi:MoaA/NifB/PqqE/SkfB family radical SAM enzyme
MLTQYSRLKKVNNFPRLPLEGSIDLSYKCNNNCRHCWLRISPDAKEEEKEVSFEEIRHIVDESKNMGCRKWTISGGEPMLRGDFEEIFAYITNNSISYSLNTNGTLITPGIARLLKRKGSKMVVLYGATAEVHDHITRNPGSFEAAMRGAAYLKEAQAGFMVQLIPLKDNYHQFQAMVSLAESLSPHYRVGAAWLYLSACGDAEINKEIIRQRLPAREAVELDEPDLSYEDRMNKEEKRCCDNHHKNDCLFASCIAQRYNFHIDPYGRMTFCSFIKDAGLRYDLRKGSFKECWENFIPSLADKVRGGKEYLENCASCEFRSDCRWCPVYGYLEHRRFSARVDYLCRIARENKKFRDNWKKNHRRYFRIADITIQVDSDLAIADTTFQPKFRQFEVDSPGKDTITLRHHFSLSDLGSKSPGREVYRKPPWAIYKNGNSWIYLGISSIEGDKNLHCAAVFNHNHTSVRIYNKQEETFLKGGLHSLTLFPSDQMFLARVLADREGCYLHSCGVDFRGKGLLFAGHSEAGKSTMADLLKNNSRILCDDRIIIRRQPEGFRIYGTWSHGDVPDVSNSCAPLKAILFLEKAKENKLIELNHKREITKRILSCLIKPFVTRDWWEKTLLLTDKLAENVPCYVLRFNKNGGVSGLLEKKLVKGDGLG